MRDALLYQSRCVAMVSFKIVIPHTPGRTIYLLRSDASCMHIQSDVEQCKGRGVLVVCGRP